MKKTMAGFVLATALMMNVSAFAEGNVVGNAAMFPLRLATGLAGGAIGIVEGGVKGVIDMEKKVFESQGRNEEDGYVQSNSLTLPFDVLTGAVVAPVGFLVGVPRGLGEGFRNGWNVWNSDLPGSTN